MFVLIKIDVKVFAKKPKCNFTVMQFFLQCLKTFNKISTLGNFGTKVIVPKKVYCMYPRIQNLTCHEYFGVNVRNVRYDHDT